MKKILNKKEYKRGVRKLRIRSKLFGTSERPRLSVFKSNSFIYAQLIDDTTGKTLASTSDMSIKKDKKTKLEKAVLVGKEIAKLGQEKKLKKVVFDRGGFIFTGRIKALADSARDSGLEF